MDSHLAGIREEERSSASETTSQISTGSQAGNNDNTQLLNVLSDTAPPPIQGTPSSIHASPRFVHRPVRRARESSQVSVDYFDPSGVRQLERTLSRMSAQEAQEAHDVSHPATLANSDKPASSSADSEATLLPSEGPFDFERSLRHFLKKSLISR